MLPLDGDAKQARKAGKKIGIRKIELTRVRAVDFQNAKREMAFAAPRDENVDGSLDAVLRQQFRRSKAGFFLKVVGNDDLAGMERKAGGKTPNRRPRLPGRSSPAPIRRRRSPAIFFPPACTPRPWRRVLRDPVRRAPSHVAVSGRCRGSAERFGRTRPARTVASTGTEVPVSLRRSTRRETTRNSFSVGVGTNSSLRNAAAGPPSACSMISCPGYASASSLPCGIADRAREPFPSVYCWARRGWKPSVCLNDGTYCSSTSYPAGDCNEAARGRLALNDAVTILVVEDDQLI